MHNFCSIFIKKHYFSFCVQIFWLLRDNDVTWYCVIIRSICMNCIHKVGVILIQANLDIKILIIRLSRIKAWEKRAVKLSISLILRHFTVCKNENSLTFCSNLTIHCKYSCISREYLWRLPVIRRKPGSLDPAYPAMCAPRLCPIRWYLALEVPSTWFREDTKTAISAPTTRVLAVAWLYGNPAPLPQSTRITFCCFW